MLKMFSSVRRSSRKSDPFHKTPGNTPTGEFIEMSGGLIKPSSIFVAGMDISSWSVVEVDVPAGPLGVLLDGSCTDAALLGDFAPVTREGTPGAVEASGKVPPGSVLVGVNKFDLLQPRKTLAEVGAILREASHLERQLRFRVPPLSYQKPEPAPEDEDTDKLIFGPTSSSTDLIGGDEPTKPKARSSFVRVTGMEDIGAASDKSPYVPSTSDKVVSVEVPPGALGLNLDGTVATRAVVLGFTPLPDGSRGVLERNGSVSSGAELVEINGEDVSKEPLARIRERLGRLSEESRQLTFRLPPPIEVTVKTTPAPLLSKTTSVASPGSVLRMSAISLQRMSLFQASLPTYTEDLDLRRRLELKLVMSYDRKELKYKECWFAVHSEWMNHWALFVGKGGPKPGAITNHELLVPGFASGEDPNRAAFVRPGLEITKDFRFVTPMVWCLLEALHGSGDAPPIARFTLDIKSEAPEDIDEVIHETKAQAVGLATNLREKCQVEDKK